MIVIAVVAVVGLGALGIVSLSDGHFLHSMLHGAPSAASGPSAIPGGSPAAAGSGSGGAGHFTLVYDGQDLTNDSEVSCTTSGGRILIGVKGEDYAAELTDTDPPRVTTVSITALNQGSSWGYEPGEGGNAEVTKDGNTYKVTGNATNEGGQSRVLKPFEFDVTCP